MRRIPLILLPGLLCDAALWRHQTRTLTDIAEITVPDLGRDDSLAAMAARVLDAAPARFALAGLSMGGYLAQEIMRAAPDRVARLALLDTSHHADRPEQTEGRKAGMDEARRRGLDGVVAALMPKLVNPGHAADPDIAATVRAMAEAVGVEAFIRQQTAIMGRPDGTADLAKIACPTLVLCGRDDILTPLDVHREMAERIPSAALVVVEDSGHLAPLEQPEAVSAVLRYWLQQ